MIFSMEKAKLTILITTVFGFVLTDISDDTVKRASKESTCANYVGHANPSTGPMSTEPEVYCVDCRAEAVCCGPEDPSNIVTMQLYRYENVEYSEYFRWDTFTDCEKVAFCQSVVYVVHGYSESINTSNYYQSIRRGWQSRHACVILVDWYEGNHRNYFQAIANVRSVGAAIAFNVWQCLVHRLSDVTIAGFSLGGQIIGETAKHFNARTVGGLRLSDCHGLDPAGPLYDDCSNNIRLDADDCQTVQVCHSDAQEHSNAPVVGGVGTNRKSGLCDFWINCGFDQRQPCTGMEAYKYLTGSEINGPQFVTDYADHQRSYDHVRCPYVYASQLNYNCFRASHCIGCADRKCPPEQTSNDTVAFIIDYNCSSESDYYVRTNSSGNFCFTFK